jgi:hypothetical protein
MTKYEEERQQMGMSAFGSRFPEIAALETRSIRVLQGSELPNGHYGFIELYCDEVDCDCRRTVIQVVSEATGPKVWATINFGWESEEFYAEWMGSTGPTPDFAGASLDPLNRQSKYADILLDYFINAVADDVYIERLKRHYALFKSSVQSEPVPHTSNTPLRSNWKPSRQPKRRLR